MPESHLERRCNAVQVGLQQLLAKAPGRGLGRPGHAGLLVGAQHNALAFLAQVALGTKVDHVGNVLAGAAVVLANLGDFIGHQVHVFHRQHWQLNTHHAADLTGPQAASVDHVLALHHALVGDDPPGAVGLLFQAFYLGLHLDGGAAQLGGLGIGVGGARWIQVAFVRVQQGADEMLVFNEREIALSFRNRDDLGVHAQVAALGHGGFQKLESLRRVGQHDARRQVQAAGLARDFFKLLVQTDGIALQHGHIGVAIERMETAGRMPGGARGKLVPLQQHHVFPAFFGQVVEHRAAHHPAANHHHLCCRLHACSLVRAV